MQFPLHGPACGAQLGLQWSLEGALGRGGAPYASSAAGMGCRGGWELALPAGFYQQAPQTYTEAELCVQSQSSALHLSPHMSKH
jgi:hypothetical protein